MAILTLFTQGLARFVTTGFRVMKGEQFTTPLSFGSRRKKNADAPSDERALQVGTVWACHSLLVDTLSILPLKLYRYRHGDAPEEVTDHPLVRVLQRKPNALMNSVDFTTALAFNLIGYGNAFSHITRDSAGECVDLFPLQASMVKTRINLNGALEYEYEWDRGTKPLPADRVWHVRAYGYSGITGLSTFGFARRTVEQAISIQDHSEGSFSNGGRPSGVFTIDKILTPDQRANMRENISARIEGEENAFRVLLLEAGMRFEKMSFSPDDLLAIEQAEFTAEDVCRYFRVPPQMVGLKVEGTAYTGLEQLNLAFLNYTIMPWLRRIAASASCSLLREEDQASMFLDFDVTPLLAADFAALASYYAALVQNGVMTRSEVRTRLKLPRVEGADVLTAQMNLAPLGMLGEIAKQPKAAPPSEPIKQSELGGVHIHVPEFKVEPLPVYITLPDPPTVVVNPQVTIEPAPPAPAPLATNKTITPNDDGSWTVKEILP